MAARLRVVSWVLLALVGALTLLGSLASVYNAYTQGRDEFGRGGPTLAEVGAWRPELVTAIRARRATASAYAAAFAVLFLFVTLGPYRRGETWAWWALLLASLVLAALVAARIPFLGTRLGAGTAALQLGLTLLALLLDAGRLRGGAR